MHQQIGIAPDGGSKMGISGVMQAKVTLVVRLIHGLPEGAQHHGLNNGSVVSICHLLQQLLVMVRGGFFTTT